MWTKKTTKSGDGEFERVGAGNHPAVLIGLIDMGTQENNYQGNITWQPRAYFVYELVMEKMTTAPGRNHILATDLTVSMNEKAKLRKWIEARTGKQIPDGVEYDISQELGQPVLLNVVLNKDGYPKIQSVGSIPRGMNIPAPQNKPTTMTLDEFRAGGKVPEFCPWLFGERIEDHIKRAQEITGKGLTEAPPAEYKGPTFAGSSSQPPPPPSAVPDERYWVSLEQGKPPILLNLVQAGQEIFTKGVHPDNIFVCKEGSSEWVKASSVGVKPLF